MNITVSWLNSNLSHLEFFWETKALDVIGSENSQTS